MYLHNGEEARRCPTCESLNHKECDEKLIRMDDIPFEWDYTYIDHPCDEFTE